MLLALIFHKRLPYITQDHATIQFICFGLHVDVYCLQCFPFHSHGSISLMRASSPFHKTAVCVCIGVVFFTDLLHQTQLHMCTLSSVHTTYTTMFGYPYSITYCPSCFLSFCCLDDSDSGSVSVTQREEDVLLGLL